MRSSTNIVLNDPKVYGTGYVWGAGTTEWQHGIQIDGGSNITLNNPVTRNTGGDGIGIGYDPGVNLPPTRVVINNPNIERSARNGIAPMGGEVTIRGGHIDYSGLHGIDFEPNDGTEAASIRAVVDGVDIRHSGTSRRSATRDTRSRRRVGPPRHGQAVAHDPERHGGQVRASTHRRPRPCGS